MKLDPRSARIALIYTGTDAGDPHLSGIPARDLTENDLAHLVTRLYGDVTEKAADHLVATLVAGPYRKTPAPAASGKSED